jgi:hypothetical protein
MFSLNGMMIFGVNQITKIVQIDAQSGQYHTNWSEVSQNLERDGPRRHPPLYQFRSDDLLTY